MRQYGRLPHHPSDAPRVDFNAKMEAFGFRLGATL